MEIEIETDIVVVTVTTIVETKAPHLHTITTIIEDETQLMKALPHLAEKSNHSSHSIKTKQDQSIILYP